MRHSVRKIVSTGFSNVERHALDAARERDFLYAGWCPKAQWVGGVLISKKYSLSETPSDIYEQAVEWNVRDSDGTLVLIREKTKKFAAFAEEMARKHQKPAIIIDFDAVRERTKYFPGYSKELARDKGGCISEWLHKNNIDILNVTGQQAPGNDDLAFFAYWLVWRILQWNDRIELCLRSPNFLRRIRGGKYKEWAADFDMDTLEGLLWAVGEFGIKLNSMRLPSGEFPDPDFQGIWAHKGRVRLGMEGIAIIQARELESWLPIRSSPGMPPQLRWTPMEREGPPIAKVDSQFSNQNLAFVPEFQKRLSSDDRTSWAQDLSANELETLLWMVGEYGIRMFSNPPPGFPGESRNVTRMRAALQMIGLIYGKKCKYNVFETKSWICSHSM